MVLSRCYTLFTARKHAPIIVAVKLRPSAGCAAAASSTSAPASMHALQVLCVLVFAPSSLLHAEVHASAELRLYKSAYCEARM